MTEYSMTTLAENIRKVAEHAESLWHATERPHVELNINSASLELLGANGMPTRESQLVSILLVACWNAALAWAVCTSKDR